MLLALVISVAVPAAKAQEADPPTADLEAKRRAVQAVLDRRVDALRSGDRDAFLTTVDPEAPDSFRAEQGRSFDGLRSVPLERYALEARFEDTGDLGAGLEARYRAPVFLPETRVRLRLEGVDDRDAVTVQWNTFVRRGDRWYVGGDRDLEALGLDTVRELWDLGDVRLKRTEHLLVLSHPDTAARADAIAGLAERALATLGERWTVPWSGRIPIVVPRSVEDLETLLQSTFDLDKFVAFVSYGTDRDDGWEATAPRMYIQDRNLGRYEERFQVETLVHEFLHAAGVAAAGPFMPNWVHEGIADWVATGRSTTERKPAGSDARLPRDHEFTIGSGEAIVRNYAESRVAITALAAAKGLGAPQAFYERVGRPKVAAGNADHHAGVALREVAGLDVAGLEAMLAGR